MKLTVPVLFILGLCVSGCISDQEKKEHPFCVSTGVENASYVCCKVMQKNDGRVDLHGCEHAGWPNEGDEYPDVLNAVNIEIRQ